MGLSRVARTDQEIVDQTNDLARKFALQMQYEMPESYKFYESNNPRAICFWRMACKAQEELTDTDPMDALSALEQQP